MTSIFTNTFSAIFGILVLYWAGSILLVTDGMGRMEKACAPVTWFGSITDSMMTVAGASNSSINYANRWFDKGEYACKYTLWGLFYKDDWEKDLNSQDQSTSNQVNSKK